MGKEKLILALLVLAGVLGLFLLGNGISGMLISDPNVKELCSPNNDIFCTDPHETCCLFYEEDSGVCNSPEMCDQITALTKSEKERDSPLLTAIESQNERMNNAYLIQTAIGGILAVVLIIAAYYLISNRKVVPRKRRA